MKSNKTLIAIADDKQDDIKIIKNALASLPQYEIIITALSGQELITKLTNAKQTPHLIFMDIEMKSGDGLITSIACYTLFKNIKIVGLSSHTYKTLINEFMAEGGSGFLSKLAIQNQSTTNDIKINNNIFEKVLYEIINNNHKYFDPICQYNDDYTKLNSTQKIILNKYAYLSKPQIKLLQLNAMGFSQKEMANIICVSLITIKRYSTELCKMFQAKNHIDLSNITINLGITKIAKLYQNFD
jgi:DNA-binding NarL/FixJ family response regulator